MIGKRIIELEDRKTELTLYEQQKKNYILGNNRPITKGPTFVSLESQKERRGAERVFEEMMA